MTAAKACRAILAGLLFVSGCAPAPQQAAAPGAAPTADPADPCGRQAANLDTARNLFAGSVIAGAALGAAASGSVSVRVGVVPASAAMLGALALGAVAGAAAGAAAGDYLERRRREAADEAALNAAVAADIARENESLDLTRNAAEFLLDCRLLRARDIREAVAEDRMTRAAAEGELATLRGLAARDAERMAELDARIRARDAELAPAMEALAPGARAEAAAVPPPLATVAPLPLRPRARPDATAVTLAAVPAGEAVVLRASREPDFVAVETPAGRRLGYVPAASFPSAPTRITPATQANAPVRFLAASNVARRDNFAETAQDMARAAAGQGFEIGI